MADTPVPANDGDWASDDGGVTARRAAEAFVVDVDGFEGPLDLLLSLARTQKVDLRAISVLALVEQYLAFIEEARALRLELAADYLVMAAWLAYLKSRLLVPRRPMTTARARGHGRAPGVPAGTAGRRCATSRPS
jgi:segregation and condensation protein A